MSYDERVVRFSTAESLNNYKHLPAHQAMRLPEFVDLFRPAAHRVTRSKTWAPVWMPAVFADLTVGRESANVTTVTAFVVDCDTLNSADVEILVSAQRAANRHFLVHSSYSYAPPEKAKVRFIFFLSRPIDIGTEWRWSDALWPKLVEHLGFGPYADPSCSDAARAYFRPIRKSLHAPLYFAYHAGADLDVDAVLGPTLAEPLSRYDFRRPYVDRQNPDKTVSTDWLRIALTCKFGNRKTEYGSAVATVLSAEATSPGDRHLILRRFTQALVHVIEEDDPTESVLEVMTPWFESIGEDRDWYAEAERALEGARAKKPTWDARREHELQQLIKVAEAWDAAT
jgi:hypothetical protein